MTTWQWVGLILVAAFGLLPILATLLVAWYVVFS